MYVDSFLALCSTMYCLVPCIQYFALYNPLLLFIYAGFMRLNACFIGEIHGFYSYIVLIV